MRDNLIGLASQEKSVRPPTPMRRHHDQIGTHLLCRRDDALRRVLVRHMDQITVEALRFRSSACSFENLFSPVAASAS